MRITKIEIKNFRAFKGLPLKINLNKTGKNLLVYGENGSGKSSLFFAIKDFMECAVRKNDITQFPFRNIFCGTDGGYIKIHFTDPNATRKNSTRPYEWSAAKNETSEQLILEVNKTKGFIDYKALLATYFLQQDTPTVNIFDLLLESILYHAENDLNRRPFGEEWQDIEKALANLNKRSPKQKEALIDKIKTFNKGLRVKLEELQGKAQEILNWFGYQLEIELHFGGVELDSQKWVIEKRIAGLKVKFFNQPREDHHRFLNEARLSAIAISVFFAALLLQPASRLRILALDDVLIGLDMSNRLPVLDILENHFAEYQIFFFTYDKPWYDIVRQRVGEQDWRHVEFYSARTDEHDLPIYADDKKYLDKAKEHLGENDYKAAVIYLRTHFEQVIKDFCNKKALKVKYKHNAKEIQGKDFWEAVKGYEVKNRPFLDSALVTRVELFRSIVLNPISHASITNTFRKEIEDSIKAIEELENELKKP
ncbi:MAG: AAA family ATPase [Acidobacteria bacterium]|nr:AAA family ATPase [Acidobacteriota bacterium]